MFRQSYNRALLHIRIDTTTPLLIKAGDLGLDPVAPDLACVRTHHAQFPRKTVYIPGASLKGVLRSTVESVVRGSDWSGIQGACDPLDFTANCGSRVKKEKDGNKDLPTPTIHRMHCLACRLFGSTTMKGRAAVRDLFPWAGDPAKQREQALRTFEMANSTEIRYGVAINRVTGAVQHGPFEQEMVPAGVSFWGEIALENYQAWQLGLLAQSFKEVNAGFAQLGSAKSRGLGVARVAIEGLLHEQAVRADEQQKPRCVGELARPNEVDAYGLLRESELPPAEGKVNGLALRFEMDAVGAEKWLAAAIAALERLENRP